MHQRQDRRKTRRWARRASGNRQGRLLGSESPVRQHRTIVRIRWVSLLQWVQHGRIEGNVTNTTDARVPILLLLRLHEEKGGGPLPELAAIAKAMGLPEHEVRRACDALETDGYVKSTHGVGGEKNPAYQIDEPGKAYLYDLEHGAF